MRSIILWHCSVSDHVREPSYLSILQTQQFVLWENQRILFGPSFPNYRLPQALKEYPSEDWWSPWCWFRMKRLTANRLLLTMGIPHASCTPCSLFSADPALHSMPRAPVLSHALLSLFCKVFQQLVGCSEITCGTLLQTLSTSIFAWHNPQTINCY